MNITYQAAPTAAFSMRGIDVSPLASESETGGSWEAIHQRVSPGGGSPLHTLASDKLFVVLAGELTLVIDGVDHLATAGASATVPAGVPHRFENRSDEPAELLVVTSGGGHIEFLRGMAALGRDGAPSAEALRRHADRYHVRLIG